MKRNNNNNNNREYSRLVEHVMGIWCLQKSERRWQSHRFTRVGDCTLPVTKTTTLFNKKKVFARGPRRDESSNITSDKAATCPPCTRLSHTAFSRVRQTTAISRLLVPCPCLSIHLVSFGVRAFCLLVSYSQSNLAI